MPRCERLVIKNVLSNSQLCNLAIIVKVTFFSEAISTSCEVWAFGINSERHSGRMLRRLHSFVNTACAMAFWLPSLVRLPPWSLSVGCWTILRIGFNGSFQAGYNSVLSMRTLHFPAMRLIGFFKASRKAWMGCFSYWLCGYNLKWPNSSYWSSWVSSWRARKWHRRLKSSSRS